MSKHLTFIQNGELGHLVIDVQDKKLNVLSSVVMRELETIVEFVRDKADIKALIIRSGKKGSFIAGADIKEIQGLTIKEDAMKIVSKGQSILSKLAHLPCLTIAAIDGVALGGGLELALACDFIAVSDNEKTQLGLPEVQLGIIPGFGGTQRLPRKIGLKQSVPMIVSGKPVNYRKAYKIGLADTVVNHTFLEDEVIKYAKYLIEKNVQSNRSTKNKFTNNRIMASVIKRIAKKGIMKKSKGHYPALLVALDVIVKGFRKPLEKGLKLEAEKFAELVVMTQAKNLQRLFFSSENIKKYNGINSPDVEVSSIHQAAVFGAGLMGGGIAWVLAKKGMEVRIRDLNWEAIQKGYLQGHKINNQLLKIRKTKPFQVKNLMDRWSATTSLKGFGSTDIVIEAIIEDMQIKKQTFLDLEKIVKPSTILASNTSSLSISEMANGLEHPERFIGMHFFSPVNRMPLVEVIPGEKTSDETTVKVVKLAQKCGKMPIVVKNCPGFLINRILMPYINEAIEIYKEGAEVAEIDGQIEMFGMPIGPLGLLDEVGIDIGLKVSKVLSEGYKGRMTPPEGLDDLVKEHQLLGKKSGKGFYVYKGKRKQINKKMRDLIPVKRNNKSNGIGNVERMMLIMINEAATCIEEGVVASPELLDVAMIFGTGFPPFRGGVCRYADTIGIQRVVDNLSKLMELHGNRFKPAESLKRLAADNKSFFSMKGEV